MKNNTIDLLKELEKHFMKYKNFYISIILSLIIIFCWCKFGKKLLEKKIDNNNENFNQIRSNKEIINEIDNILQKIN